MRFRNRSSEQPGFQLAPMIDVIFILLSFFVATQIFSRWEYEIDIDLPTVETGEVPARLPGEVKINILRDGTVRVNQQDMDSTQLSGLLSRIVELWPGQSIVIRADRRTEYDHVMRVLDMCRQADIWNISFATSEGEAAGDSAL